MATMPKKPTQMKKDDAMKDDLFGEELSLADDVSPESSIDAGLESERVGAGSAMGGGELTPEEESILMQAADIKAKKGQAAEAILGGASMPEMEAESAPEDEMSMEDESEDKEEKKLKLPSNLRNMY